MLTLIGIIDKASNVLIETRTYPSLSVWNRELTDIMSQEGTLSRHPQDFQYAILTENLSIDSPMCQEAQKFEFSNHIVKKSSV